MRLFQSEKSPVGVEARNAAYLLGRGGRPWAAAEAGLPEAEGLKEAWNMGWEDREKVPEAWPRGMRRYTHGQEGRYVIDISVLASDPGSSRASILEEFLRNRAGFFRQTQEGDLWITDNPEAVGVAKKIAGETYSLASQTLVAAFSPDTILAEALRLGWFSPHKKLRFVTTRPEILAWGGWRDPRFSIRILLEDGWVPYEALDFLDSLRVFAIQA